MNDMASKLGPLISRLREVLSDMERMNVDSTPVARVEDTEDIYEESICLSDSGSAIPLVESATKQADGNVLIKLIAPGWGSSGYYPESVLKRDGPNIFNLGSLNSTVCQLSRINNTVRCGQSSANRDVKHVDRRGGVRADSLQGNAEESIEAGGRVVEAGCRGARASVVVVYGSTDSDAGSFIVVYQNIGNERSKVNSCLSRRVSTVTFISQGQTSHYTVTNWIARNRGGWV